MCVVSDYLQHSTVAVHRFQQDVLQHVKQLYPYITKIFYFSEASQYKNCKNFCNLVYHVDDFKMEAEWHFFATSHGKNACDGVGGTVKHEAAKASLQAVTRGHILTPKQLYEWGCQNIQNVHFFYRTKEEVMAHEIHQNKQKLCQVPEATTAISRHLTKAWLFTDHHTQALTKIMYGFTIIRKILPWLNHTYHVKEWI